MVTKKTNPTFRDHEAAIAGACQNLPPIAVAAGENDYLRHMAITRLTDAIETRHPDIDRLVLRAGYADAGAPPDWPLLLSELQGRSIFSQRKLVILRDANRLFFPGRSAAAEADDAPPGASASESSDSAAPDREVEKFYRLLTQWPSEVWFIADCSSLQQHRILGKKLAANAFIIPCPALTQERQIAEWLERHARSLAAGQGRHLTPGAAHWLAQAHGGNLWNLSHELEKIDLYLLSQGGRAGPESQPAAITEETVAHFFGGTIEYGNYALTNALEARDANEAIHGCAILSRQGIRDRNGKPRDASASASEMLFRLPYILLGLLAGAMAHATRGGTDAVAAWTKTTPYRAQKMLQGGRLYGIPHLRRCLALLAEETRAAHDTGGDPRLALERVVMALVL